jgi:membrane-associated HD superfamily phosphohydrolase
VRAGFEFLPVAWLRVYRLLKNWMVNPPSGLLDEKTSIVRDFRKHRLTIMTSIAILELVIFVHLRSNPHLMFILFYAIPCVLVALVVNARWATLFVLAASIVPPIIQYDGDSDYRATFVVVWNLLNRFILLEVFILMLSRIRMDFKKTGFHVK